ncbi:MULTISPECIES: hypothetical protein [unclassified Streptomyces]|nr:MULTISPECIES: hypothetical protein [unclassified Streptomyces]ODA70542.1 hypothetical protein APS67_005276 [Streptomyces sp. AVP053U2]
MLSLSQGGQVMPQGLTDSCAGPVLLAGGAPAPSAAYCAAPG